MADIGLPFVFTSASDGVASGSIKRNFPITNNHINFEAGREATLQSPFTYAHVGGLPHRHVPFGTPDDERAEAYTLTFTDDQVTISRTPINKPKSMFFRGVSGTRFMNFSNIRNDAVLGTLGNYDKDYEIVLTNARSSNNKYFLDNNGDWLQEPAVVSTFVDQVVDFEIPERPKAEHVITNRFSSPGGPETTALTRDRTTEEYSAYNTMNYRNLVARTAQNLIDQEHAEQFGYRSGSSTNASRHKVNRNPLRFMLGEEEAVRFDNNFITHPIPQSEYQYSWITASVDDDVYDFLRRNNNNGYVSNFPLKHKEYSRDFSQETVNTLPSGWSTIRSEQTVSYVRISDYNRLEITASLSGFLDAPGFDITTSEDLIISEARIFRSSSSGYELEYDGILSTGSANFSDFVINSIILNETRDLISVATDGGAVGAAYYFDIHRSSSSGWAYETTLYASSDNNNYSMKEQFFSGSTLVYIDQDAQDADPGDIYWYTSHSAGGWIESGSNLGGSRIWSRGGMPYDPETQTAIVPYGGSFSSIIYNHSTLAWEIDQSAFAPLSEGTLGDVGAIAFDGNTVAIGRPGTETVYTGQANSNGVVNLHFLAEGGSVDLESPVRDFADGFGKSLAFKNGFLAIGSPRYDLTAGQQQKAEVENDKGAVFIYKIDRSQPTGSWATLQTIVYDTRTNPHNTSYFGQSCGFTNSELVVESPGEGDVYIDVEDYSTHVNIYGLVSSSSPINHSLSGSIISGSDSNAFLVKGDTIMSPEISQFPAKYLNNSGDKFRVIETSLPITTSQPEFIISVEVIEGSANSADLSNSSYGLASTPSTTDLLLLQYKMGSGNWNTTKIVIGGNSQTGKTTQNSFIKYESEPIKNNKVEEIDIRIISNSTSQDSSFWGIKSVALNNTNGSLKSENKLVSLNEFRKEVIKSNEVPFDYLSFTNLYASQLSNLMGSSPLGSRPGDHDVDLYWNDNTGDLPRSMQMWLRMSEVEVEEGTVSYIATLTTHPRSSYSYNDGWAFMGLHSSGSMKLKMQLKRSSGYYVETIDSLSPGRWYHLCVTYDGQATSTIDGLKIYVNGVKKNTIGNRETTSYTRMFAGNTLNTNRIVLGFSSTRMIEPYSFVGGISNLAFFDKELNSTEVRELYSTVNNSNELYSLLKDPLGLEDTSIYQNLIAYWPFNQKSKTIDTSSGYAIYTDIVSGYELVGEDLPTNTSVQWSRIAPQVVNGTLSKIVGLVQDYDIVDNTTLASIGAEDFLKNTLSNYSYPSWLQIRSGDTPVARKQKKDNKLTISVRGQEVFPSSMMTYYHDQNSDLTTTPASTSETTARTVEVYDEVMLSSKYQPLTITMHTSIDQNIVDPRPGETRIVPQEQMREHWQDEETLATVYNGEIPLDDSRLVVLRVTAPNDLAMFSNEELNNKLELDEHKRHNITQVVQGLSDVASTEDAQLEITYKETLYPRGVNTYTEKVRTRTLFDFYSWRDLAVDRKIILTGSNSYGQALVNVGSTKVFPDITVDKYDYKKSNEFYADSRNITNRFASSPSTDNLTVSRWPLDARNDFSTTPASIRKSYFNQGDLALLEAQIGESGEGVLQNDYSIFGLGYNGLYGTPPASALYSRRIPQISGSEEYLAGEAKWQAATQSGHAPYENSGETTEKLRRLWQDHSLVPEYKVSEYVEDIVLNQDSDFSKVRDKSDYLSITGAVYHTSSQEVSVGTNFFKTYGTSDFMKYFGMTLDEVKENNLGGAAQLTLKCNAAIKFTPYRGFYPAERTLQISELLSRGYMPNFSVIDDRQTAADRLQVTSPEKMIDRKIRANLQQAIKPLMAPGVLYNSIKSGMAVDYPIFGSSTDDATLINFNTEMKDQINPLTEFTGTLAALTKFTGSVVNSTSDEGIPRLSGSVSKRVTFEDLLEPQRLIGTKIYDNEPHPSASIYYGDSAITKVFDYPFQFGKLDEDNNQSKLFAGNFTLSKTLDDTLTPYKMAINNFCAETVNFFLEGGKVASLESDQINPNLVSGTAYKMRIDVKNNSLTMYDRHSAFGPAVDEGDLTFTQISGTAVTNPGVGSIADFGAASITVAASSISTTNFIIQDSGSSTITIHIQSGSTGSDISTGVYGPGGGTEYDVSEYGGVYASGPNSYIDLASIEASSKPSTEALNRLMEVAVNYHRWQGSIDIEAALIDGNIRLRQLTTGSAGDTTITSTGDILSLYPDFPSAFVSGAADTTDFTGVTTTSVTVSSSHEYAPFVPPFLDTGAEPYVDITFTPSESRTYSLEEILQNSEYEYVNFKETPSNAATNTNYKHAMALSASLDLQNFVAYQEGNTDTGTTLEQRKRWVIQTKWETPVLNFKNVSVDALNLSSSTVESVSGSPWQDRTWNQYLTKSVLTQPEEYLTASTGMWHQYGSLLESNEGYTISIKKVEGIADEAQLARKVGFLGEDMKPVSVTPGRVAEKKEISEAVVAIPFYVDQKGNKMKFFTVKNSLLKGAMKLNKEKREEYQENIHGLSVLSEAYKGEREEYLDFFNNPGATGKESIAYQMRMMSKFVFPPQFDYYTYPDLSQKPMMYIFQFNAELTKQDLANIWQNLSPQSVKSGASPRGSSVYNPDVNGIRQDVQYVSNFLTKRHLPWSQRKAFFENDVRWLIFKVKQRAENDLAKVKMKSLPGSQKNLMIDQARTSIKEADYLQDKRYSYNWPYDYFSLVELIKVEGKVDFLPFGDDGTR